MMTWLHFVNILTFQVSFLIFVSCVLCNVQNSEKLYWRSYLPNAQFLRLYGLTFSECVLECKLRPRCSSITYKLLIQKCEINDINASLWTRKTPGIVFAKRTDWKEVILNCLTLPEIIWLMYNWQLLIQLHIEYTKTYIHKIIVIKKSQYSTLIVRKHLF